MKIFGKPSSFAIEAMIEAHLVSPSTPWGRMRIWCQGVPLGDIEEEYCGLDQAFDRLFQIATNIDSYWTDEFASMLPLEIIDLLDAKLFGCCGDEEVEDDRTIDQIRIDADHYRRFSFLTNWGEQFDRVVNPFLLCLPTGEVCILSRAFALAPNHTLLTTKEDFCSTVLVANSWFQIQRTALSAVG